MGRVGREMPIERRRSAQLAAAAVRAPGLGSPPPAEASAASAVTSRCSTNLLTSLKSTAPRYRPLTGHCRPGKVHNESSCSSPADGTPRSPADDTRTSPDEESPCSHSSTCRRSSSILCRLDSGQQPHPRNMDDSKDAELLRILGYARMHQKQINSRWYQEDAVLERILKTSAINSMFPGIDLAMLKQRIPEFEKMVIDYYEGKLTTMPNQDLMLYVFSNIMHDYEQIPETPLNSGKRATLVSEELEAPSTKRARSERVDMVMYLSNPDAASKRLKGGLGMDVCTTRAEYLLHDSHMLYPAITLLRQNIEIRQSFMTFGDSHARGYIEYELKQHGML